MIADLNFELPALAHGTRARIRCCYEYVHYIKEYLDGLPELTKAYPEMTSVTAPIETWSDDFRWQSQESLPWSMILPAEVSWKHITIPSLIMMIL